MRWAIPLVLVAALPLSCSTGDDAPAPSGPDSGGAPSGPESGGASSGADSGGAPSVPDPPGQGGRPELPPVPEPGDYLPAFPGAEGFGTETPGGREGTVYVVTTLDWEGPGSFSEAMLATEPRIIVFEVSGVIEAPAPVSLSEEHSFVTVAGQSSPGGITFEGFVLESYQSDFHDAVFRHLRFRGNGNYDNVSFNQAHHLVFDHCDFSGGTDETFDVTASYDVTLQWSTIANSDATGQNYGSLIAYAPTTRFSFHHNLYAHHANRCYPHMHWEGGIVEEGVTIDFRNNVLYNCSFDAGMYLNGVDEGAERMFFNVVGNYQVAGPQTPESAFTFALVDGANLFAEDNLFPNHEVFSASRELTDLDAPAEAPEVVTASAEEALDLVLAYAGSFPRDAMNERVVQEVRDGSGMLGVIDDPRLEGGPEPPADTDRDGMPDEWETERGLDPGDEADASEDRDDDGYTNVEEYLNELSDAIVAR